MENNIQERIQKKDKDVRPHQLWVRVKRDETCSRSSVDCASIWPGEVGGKSSSLLGIC